MNAFLCQLPVGRAGSVAPVPRVAVLRRGVPASLAAAGQRPRSAGAGGPQTRLGAPAAVHGGGVPDYGPRARGGVARAPSPLRASPLPPPSPAPSAARAAGRARQAAQRPRTMIRMTETRFTCSLTAPDTSTLYLLYTRSGAAAVLVLLLLSSDLNHDGTVDFN